MAVDSRAPRAIAVAVAAAVVAVVVVILSEVSRQDAHVDMRLAKLVRWVVEGIDEDTDLFVQN